MREWETMTWNEISGKRDHAIGIDSLSPEAKKRLIEIELDDIDGIFSLHLGGKKRLIGIRDRNIFRVLWWDKEHKVCQSTKNILRDVKACQFLLLLIYFSYHSAIILFIIS